MAHPAFAYADKTLQCTDCGQPFTFSAHEQQYWYEQLQFVPYSAPKHCVPCRRQRRIYKRHFHDLQRALATLDPHSAPQLLQVAELYLQIGHHPKALEFMRRAKTKIRNPSEKAELQQRIKSIQREMEAQAAIWDTDQG